MTFLRPIPLSGVQRVLIVQTGLGKRLPRLVDRCRGLFSDARLEVLLREGDASLRDEIDVAMSQLYDRLETLETHRHDSHGWVWLYRQLPAATPNQESEPTATNTHGHVRMTCTASAPGTGDHRVRSIDVQFLVDRGWTIAPATGGGWSIPTELDVSLSKGYTVQSIDWPEPRQQKIDGVITSVYEGPITIKVQVAAETSPAPASCNYTIHGSWQACSTRTGICVRGSTVVTAGF